MFVTSYNEDFKWPKTTGRGIKKWPREIQVNENKEKHIDPVYRNSETLTQLNAQCLTPFCNLLLPKPILQTNPFKPFSVKNLPEDNEDARLTRPRVYKTPEISLDDIQDTDVRQKIIDFTYSTTWGLASQDVGAKVTKREVKNCTWEPPYHLLFNSSDTSEVCENGITDAKLNEWDRKQNRFPGDPTTRFWRQHYSNTPVKVNDEEITKIKSPQFTKKILDLSKKDCLRMPFIRKLPNYTGFLPSNPIGIQAEKPQLDFSEPMVTISQLANRWRETLKE